MPSLIFLLALFSALLFDSNQIINLLELNKNISDDYFEFVGIQIFFLSKNFVISVLNTKIPTFFCWPSSPIKNSC